MKNFIIHDTVGKILRTGSCPDTMLSIQAGLGETVIEGLANDATQYVSAGVITSRPLLTTVATWDVTTIVANGTAKATLGATLPNPTKVSITPPPNSGIASIADQTIIDGAFTLATTVAGAYTVTATAFPYQDYTVTINAT